MPRGRPCDRATSVAGSDCALARLRAPLYAAAMRFPIAVPLVLAAGVASIAYAAPSAVAAEPTSLGVFQAWTAATYVSGGQKICYAFTRPSHSDGAAASRGPVLLSVTEREGSRDEVAVSAGFSYAKGAEVTVDVGATKLPFYTSGNAAFARDGAAAVKAFKAGNNAEAHSPQPHGGDTVDTFSLTGFTAAYQAIVKACPEK